MEPRAPSPNGSKCRIAACLINVPSNRLYCIECYWMLPKSYKDKLMDAYDPKCRLGFQPLEFARARLAADKYIEQTLQLLRAQKEDKRQK